MDPLFNKSLVFSDTHFGRSGNSPIANKDNLEFIQWAIDEAKTWGAETCLMLGDWFNNRNLTGNASHHAALRGLEMISRAFSQSWFLSGNHDLYHKEKRDITSIEFARHIANITVVNDPVVIGDVALWPWLMPGEHKLLLPSLKARYLFGHLELSGFMTNTRYEMPETEHSQKAEMFKEQEYVFCGHFHHRQFKKNVCYIGNAMPFDFNDDNDSDRGIMLIEYGEEPSFRSWPQQPLYRSMKLSEVLADPGGLLRPNMTVRVSVDVPLRYEEGQEIKDALMSTYRLRKFEIAGGLVEKEQDFDNTNIQFRSVDQMVISGLESVESAELSSQRLIQIYTNLPL